MDPIRAEIESILNTLTVIISLDLHIRSVRRQKERYILIFFCSENLKDFPNEYFLIKVLP